MGFFWKLFKKKCLNKEQRQWIKGKREEFIKWADKQERKVEYFVSDEKRMTVRRGWEHIRTHMDSPMRKFMIVFILLTYLVGSTSYSTNLIGSVETNKAGFLIVFFYWGLLRNGHFIFVSIASFIISILISFWFLRFDLRDEMRDDRGFTRADTNEYGSSQIMPEKEREVILGREVSVKDITGNILGVEEETGRVIELNQDLPPTMQLGVHTFICGSSGMRKSRSVAIPYIYQYIKRGESFIATDPKGELYGKTKKLAEKNGYEVRVLNLVDPICSDGVAFLKIVGTDEIMAQRFAEIVVSNASDGNGTYDDAYKALVAFGILYVALDENISDDQRTFGQVYRFLVESCTVTTKDKDGNPIVSVVDSLNRMSMIAANLPQNHPAKKQWDIFINTSANFRGNILTGLAAKLQLLGVGEIDAITKYDEIDLTAPGKKKCAYYVIMPDTEQTFNYIAAVFFSFLFIKLVRYADRRASQRCEIPVNFMLDEFPNIGNIPGFKEKMNTIRSRGLHATIICQDLGQMMDRYPGHGWESIISACDTMILLGLNEHVTNAQWWEKKTGTMTIVEEYINSSGDRRYRKGPRHVFMADEIDHLDRSEELLFLSGYNVLKCKKFDYSNHPYADEMELELASRHTPDWWKYEEGNDWFEKARDLLYELWAEQDAELQNNKKDKKKKSKAQVADEYFAEGEIDNLDSDDDELYDTFIGKIIFKITGKDKAATEPIVTKKVMRDAKADLKTGMGAHVVTSVVPDEQEEIFGTKAEDILRIDSRILSDKYNSNLNDTEDGFNNFDYQSKEDFGSEISDEEAQRNADEFDEDSPYEDTEDYGEEYATDDYDLESDEFFNIPITEDEQGEYSSTGNKF